jgi:hypothetical protein
MGHLHVLEKTEHHEHFCFLKCPPNNEEGMHEVTCLPMTPNKLDHIFVSTNS